ncbi:protein kinase domain-containing protein [Mycolicibacter minnesotensis]
MDEVFGRYRLRELLGAGGMGQVFRAFDTELQREVAIKVLAPQVGTDPAFAERFRREARTAAALGEPHVVPIFDSGAIDGRLFIAMQLIAGTDVATLLKQQGPVPAQRAVEIVAQAAAALDAAHAAGLVHRDIKPANLMVAASDFTYLIDFGIARAPGELALTATGATIGTVAYMAPERFTTGRVDKFSDIYALTCVLYECLTGVTPYPVGSVEQQMFAHVSGPPPAPSRARAGIPVGLDAVIARGMAQDPERRYPSAGALAEAARVALHGYADADQAERVVAAPAGAWHERAGDGGAAASATAVTLAAEAPPMPLQGPDHRTRRRWPILLAVVVLVVGTVGGGAAWFHSRGAAESKPGAPRAVTITATIGVGMRPGNISVDPHVHAVYVVNSDDGTVSAIDAAANAVTSTINVGKGAISVAVDDNHRSIYVLNEDPCTISTVDTVTHAVTATAEFGGSGCFNMAINRTHRQAYVANFDANSVSSIYLDTNEAGTTLGVGGRPFGVAVDPTGITAADVNAPGVFVTSLEANTVSVIDSQRDAVTATIAVGRGPGGVAVYPVARRVYVANNEDNSVSVIDMNTNVVMATIAVGKGPSSVAVDENARAVYVTNTEDGTVSVIDADTHMVTATVVVGGAPWGVAVDPTTHAVYVTNTESGTVSVLTPSN